MINYKLSVERTVGRLVPLFIRKSRQYGWVLSLLSPLIGINEEFVEFAAFNIKAAKMSSQTMLLENYLNELFPAPDGSSSWIKIIHSLESARDTYFSTETPLANPPYNDGHMILYSDSETIPATKDTAVIYLDTENSGALPEDFRVAVPSDIATSDEIKAAISAVVNKYVIDTKTYDTIYI